MKNITGFIKLPLNVWLISNPIIKSLVVCAFVMVGLQTKLSAQEPSYGTPAWWFGAAAGGNFNFYDGSTQHLNANFSAPAAFTKGFGIGGYLSPLVEYHLPNTTWGVMLQAGYDNRRGSFDQAKTEQNYPTNLTAKISYITVEPSLRVAPFQGDFYLYGGPRFAFNVSKSFTYKQGISPNFPNDAPSPDVTGDFNNISKTLISMQVAAGYDILCSSQYRHSKFVISPFVSYQPKFGQAPRSSETWDVSTLRIGLAFKGGYGKKVQLSPQIFLKPPVERIEPEVMFSVYAPKNIPTTRRVREIFPLRNYVFFNIGSTEIPDRYELLRKDQVKDFKEDQLEVFAPKHLSGRSEREMVVYYNVLNILGDRMGKSPLTNITLVGSSELGPQDGRAMAESIKKYLVNTFGIEAPRISIEGRDKPKIPSEQPGATRELELLREGDRRVSIESSAPILLMEFQSGPNANLKPVEINAVQDAPLDSYLTFNVYGAKEAYTSWSLEITDDRGAVQYLGPFTSDKVRSPGKLILGSRPEGDYKVVMIGQTKSGKTVRKETSVHIVLWTPPENEQGMRYSVLYEFNDSKAIMMYEKYLTDVVAPKIPQGGRVIIHGHTDIIGDEVHNLMLSLARANDVKSILANSLLKAGRSDVKFEVDGFGEDEIYSPFENKFPEERFYNRTVIIDIIPQ